MQNKPLLEFLHNVTCVTPSQIHFKKRPARIFLIFLEFHQLAQNLLYFFEYGNARS